MLADLLPLMTDTVRQRKVWRRDVFGKPITTYATDCRARVVYSPGNAIAPASREPMTDATAVVWLIDHPHPIAIGDVFELSSGEALKVARLERRVLPDGVPSKAYLT